MSTGTTALTPAQSPYAGDRTGAWPVWGPDGAPCAGVFDPRPGTWGQRRMPLFMGGFAAAI